VPAQSRDDQVAEALRHAGLATLPLDRLRCEERLEIMPRAAHLFDQPGALDAVIGLARDW
jgi:hypothetical protein